MADHSSPVSEAIVSAIARARRYLLDHQTPQGGWGYHAGGMPFADATVLAALAIGAPSAPAARALDFLLGLRRQSGFATCAPDREPSWMTAHALLLLARYAPAQRDTLAAASGWLLDGDRAYSRPGLAAAGWPWVADTASWVEPTAWTILALGATGHAGARRVGQGVDMLSRNVSKGGGWSLYEHRPFPYHTGLVLLALDAAGATGGPVIAQALGFLATSDASTPSALDAAFRAWALVRARSAGAASAVDALIEKVGADGAAGTGPFDTAAAVLALQSCAGADSILPESGSPDAASGRGNGRGNGGGAGGVGHR